MTATRSGPSGADTVDSRTVYRRTPAGDAEVAERRLSLAPAARRLLMLIDAQRPAGQLALSVRSGELSGLLRDLEDAGLVVVARILEELPPELVAGNHSRLMALKQRLHGAFVRELGTNGAVLEARIQDCVNLMVMRSVLREVVEQVQRRRDRAAAERILRIVRRDDAEGDRA
ncbi:MAG TPA: hypothetical protein VM491_11645 [Burkholderiaceae bacterium]|nr:hypothetical protein [Burkholderiaceae bacterium]